MHQDDGGNRLSTNYSSSSCWWQHKRVATLKWLPAFVAASFSTKIKRNKNVQEVSNLKHTGTASQIYRGSTLGGVRRVAILFCTFFHIRVSMCVCLTTYIYAYAFSVLFCTLCIAFYVFLSFVLFECFVFRFLRSISTNASTVACACVRLFGSRLYGFAVSSPIQ